MAELTLQQKLPKTLDLIRAATAHPAVDHTQAWNSVKEELTTFLNTLRQCEENHRDNKVITLKKWEAKAGMLEKKRIDILGSNADEHDQMHAAGVPGHVMLRFREENAELIRHNQFLNEKVQELKALGFQSVGGQWILPWRTGEPGERKETI